MLNLAFSTPLSLVPTRRTFLSVSTMPARSWSSQKRSTPPPWAMITLPPHHNKSSSGGSHSLGPPAGTAQRGWVIFFNNHKLARPHRSATFSRKQNYRFVFLRITLSKRDDGLDAGR